MTGNANLQSQVSYTVILIVEQVGRIKNPNLCLDTIPKQLNFELDPSIDKTRKIV